MEAKMSQLLKGKPVADKLKEELLLKISKYKNQGIQPKIAIIRVGNKEDDLAYEIRVMKNCTALGIEPKSVLVPEEADTQEVLHIIQGLNKDKKIHGIMLFRPLPHHLDENQIVGAIQPEKDIDCMNPDSLSRVFQGNSKVLPPCTPCAVIEILKYYGYDLEGLNVVIVNRSMVLGKPLAMLLLKENATVTLCHSKTKDLKDITKKADVVVTGVGRGHYFDTPYFSEWTTVIDVGINFVNGTLCGDVKFESVRPEVKGITPVPGGVGAVTSMILLKHVVDAIELQLNPMEAYTR